MQHSASAICIFVSSFFIEFCMFRIYKMGKALEKCMHFCHYFGYYLKDSLGKLETRCCSSGLYSFCCLSALQPFAATVLSLIQLPSLVL